MSRRHTEVRAGVVLYLKEAKKIVSKKHWERVQITGQSLIPCTNNRKRSLHIQIL
jgi:hypothetical protein